MLSLGNGVYHGARHKLSSLCLCVHQLAIVFGYMSYISSLQLLIHLMFIHKLLYAKKNVFDCLYCATLSGYGLVPHHRMPSTEPTPLHTPMTRLLSLVPRPPC